ncbi:putative ubiquitin hydrolase, putative,cysteine peptidase, Clan CA, family C19 [Trypanosoma grayi]|uniref:putative ubiquitin hydrolase, putative,cysteine peptidase, Clan CA, family C19 n=1 Tax=Trypanosoma grayi TaxID=71804 RepID=UPI0004F4A34E|nr:putative ubiquitin hydrolase, putative,cysteine peptidase, Clan CA, family C19 [Trypanosoma grayi]KEG09839.1 putative ubiquitin hydrolase, putative,cysteine peptidase, Clan CA, family C19 [Trypanosoma grayi]
MGMNLLETANGFVGRDVIFRPIQFERYRKPCVVSYPRRAVVLNPNHTREHRRDVGERGGKNDAASSSSSSSSSRSEDDEDVDDDDPLHLEEEQMVCSNEQLKQQLHLRWRHIGPSGCGLRNLGNTCFANSVLQALAYTPALAQYFAKSFKAPCSNAVGASYDFAYALGETVRRIHATPSGVYRPALIVSHLKSLSPQFELGRQCDAHEFACHLLHACNRSILFRQLGSTKVPLRIEQTSALQRIAGGCLRSVVSWNRREEIQRLMNAGKVQDASDLKMNKRGSSSSDVLESKTYDPFGILNVEVEGHTLSHCLAKLCEKEKLDGRSYISPRGVGVHATKQFRIHKLPYVLIIHLKRFDCMNRKVNKYVQYPKVLDIAPFCTEEGLLRATNRRRSAKSKEGSACLYELNAVCVHEGRSLTYGHYYSVVRARNGTWMLCNDEHLSHCNEEDALRQQAYMLFYTMVEQPSSHAADARKMSSGALQEWGKHHRPTSAPAAMPSYGKEDTETDIGRQLTDEEVERIRRERIAARQGTLHTANGKDKAMSRHSSEQSKEAATAGERQAGEKGYSSSNGDDDSDGNGAADEEDIFASTVATPARKENTASRNGQSGAMYRGIIKAIHRPALPAAAHTAEAGSRVVGPRAAAAVQGMRQQSLSTTVARPLHAPKFQQRVRDPLWEIEMDRGRVKRLRTRRDDYDGENKFQKSDIAFDSRGRRRREK